MKLYLHIWTNLEYFKTLNKGFLLSLNKKKEQEIAKFFSKNYPWELENKTSAQYKINFDSLKQLKKKFWDKVFDKIDGIYYWSDNCEFLLPSITEIKEALSLFKEFNKVYPPYKKRTFTLVTPYVWNTMLLKLEEIFKFLNNYGKKTEIVINDFWSLNIIKKYDNLVPIFWRLLHKQLKTPLIDSFWYSVHPSGEQIAGKNTKDINKIKDNIINWQLKFYSSSESNLKIYQNFLLNHSVNRVTLDYMSNKEKLFKTQNTSKIWCDLYYPWWIVFTWRLCDTSAIETPERWYYAIDEICNRSCFRYDINYKISTKDYTLLQRWNSWFRSETNLDWLPSEFYNNENNRIIYSPFITV